MTLLLFALGLAALYWLCLSGTRLAGLRIPIAALLISGAVASLCFAGWRWPRAPLLIWGAWLGWRLLAQSSPLSELSLPAPRVPKMALRTRFYSHSMFVGGVLFSVCALNLAQLALKDLDLPALTGPHAVAKHRWVIRTPRPDPHNPDPFAQREFLVDVYYPTLVNGQMQRAPYLSAPMLKAAFRQDESALQRFLFEREVGLMRSNSWEGTGSSLPPGQSKYPVVIFSPGLGWFADVHTSLLEQLASHGYIVFAITHPGQTPLVEFPDGHRARWGWSTRALTEDLATSKSRESQEEARWKAALATLDKGELPPAASVREMMSLNVSPTRDYPLSVRSDDIVDLLDRLEGLNRGIPASEFTGRLDMVNIAITGMSYGGPTAANVCLDDTRCKAVVNLDGEEFGRLPLESGTRPALWLYRAERWQGTPLRRIAYERYAGPAYRAGFAGAQHTTFSDQPFWPGTFDVADILLPRWLFTRREREERALSALILKYELDFLDHYLRGKKLTWLKGAPVQEGVFVVSRNVGTSEGVQ